MIHKLFEETPLVSAVIRCCSIFEPTAIVDKSSSLLQKWLKQLLGHLIKCNILSTNKCDNVPDDFVRFMEIELKKYNLEFQQFNQTKQRLDEFHFQVIQVQKFESLAFVLKLIFTLNHSQAAVERLFSINKNVLSKNMEPETIVARKTIKDNMLFSNLKPETIEMSTELPKAARGAAQKRKLALEE